MCLFRGSVLFEMIAAFAGRNHVHPGVRAAPGCGDDMVATQVLIEKFLAAIHTEILVSSKKDSIAQGRFFGLTMMDLTGARDDAVKFDDRLFA